MLLGSHVVRPRRPVDRSVALTALLALVAALLAATTGTSRAATPAQLYVSPSGNDGASGSASAPLRTIGAAVGRTPAGGTVVVESGSYHESIVLVGRGDRTITAAPGATVWMDGSRAVDGWVQSGGVWVASGWTAQFDSSPTYTSGAPDGAAPFFQFVGPGHPMAAHPDQVWVDGAPQTQVADRSQVTASTFYVDDAADQLVLGTDPSGRSVTASDLPKALSVREPGDTINGINVRNYATSVPLMGSVTLEDDRNTFSNAQVVDNATTGVFAMGDHDRVSGTVMARNGMMGFLANRASDLVLDHVSVVQNNQQQFNAAPSAGGAKLCRVTRVVVRDSDFEQNNGTGLWFDLFSYDVQVLGSRLVGNAVHGLSLELSGRTTVAGDVITGNGGDGIKVNDTDRTQIWNNTVAGNGRGIDIVQDGRDRAASRSDLRGLPMSLRIKRIQVHNNVLGRPGAASDCELCVQDYSNRFAARRLHLRINGNVYQRPTAGRSRWLIVWSKGHGSPAVFTSLRGFRRYASQERRGKVLAQVDNLHTTHGQRWLVAHTAVPVPRSIAAPLGTRPGSKHLGPWRS